MNILIHIGKCGGMTSRLAIEQSTIKIDRLIHIQQPPIDHGANYYIIARSPISRAISAFNWRKFLVGSDKIQASRFPGEQDVLDHYGSINNLAEALYHTDSTSNKNAQSDFRKIHHLRESISFYLKDLLKEIRPEQIKGCVMQESLTADLDATFGVSTILKVNLNRTNSKPDALNLSDVAHRHLLRYLESDFECLDILHKWDSVAQIS